MKTSDKVKLLLKGITFDQIKELEESEKTEEYNSQQEEKRDPEEKEEKKDPEEKKDSEDMEKKDPEDMEKKDHEDPDYKTLYEKVLADLKKAQEMNSRMNAEDRSGYRKKSYEEMLEDIAKDFM